MCSSDLRGIVVVVVEEVVEELELGAEAINGGSDTMKSIAVQERNKGKQISTRERERDLMKKSLYIINQLNQIQAPIYIKVTISVKSRIILTNS